MRNTIIKASGLSGLLAAGLLVLAPAAAVSGEAAKVPTPAELMEALRSKSTRAVGAPLSKEEVERRALIAKLKAKATRGLSMPERQVLAKAVGDQPKVDLEVFFEFNSADIKPDAEPALRSLGEALKNASSDFLVAGHTDAKGKPSYNQTLSQRRAVAIRKFLMSNYEIPADRLMAVGYGREQLKNKDDPLAAENRRVQIVNMADK